MYTVLAALLLARGKTVSDERLSTLLWGWEPPATRNAQLYTYVSRLRKHLGPEIELVREPPGYLIRTGSARLDLVEFEQFARNGREALAQRRYHDSARYLRAALRLWRGTALANVTEHLAAAEQPRLDEVRLTVLQDRIEAEMALGRHHQLVPELVGLVSQHPVREGMRIQLMTALCRCNRQSDALAAYYEGRRVLAEELGIDPGFELNAAYQAVLDGSLAEPVVGIGQQEAGVRPVPAMVPPETPDFTGRSLELAHLRELLQVGRRTSAPSSCVLITGMAGVGKTSLALRAAHANASLFPDGDLYADLRRPDGSAKNPSEVLKQFLRALGVNIGRHQGNLDELTRLFRTHIAGKRLLVVLDDAVGDSQLAPLLPHSSASGVIVTSRKPLAGTVGHRVCAGPLTENEAVDLLAATAGSERFLAEPTAARTIVDLCGRLPLPIRVAGLRLATRPQWSATVLVRRLEDPATRLDELRFGELSVQATLANSMMEISEATRLLLPRLAAVGHAEFPVSTAAEELGMSERAAGWVLDELLDAWLLETAGTDRAGRFLYRFHELVLLYMRYILSSQSCVEVT
ncbi:BTAD domain-containing putative transcriptional regulator [Amycolatopsis sp. WAC 04169]|uniref:AfsR/SARP family transcriptional regulator n=1 Tax=Amycolatopsis sp. WAC 04169 TaxID=2203197 RepID=UPI0018F305DC|nr:BTAD domain-containing putative transcriptional regulator [Amycolatopsis sp. WAC 04169]